MTIIDLGTIRATRAAEIQTARELTATAIATVTKVAEVFADVAFSLSGPVRFANEQLAVDVNRSQWRRVLSIVRTSTRQGTPEVRKALRDVASDAFGRRLDHLIRQDDQRLGTARLDEVIGGMWSVAGRKPWKPNPWPCTTTLGRLGTLAWMNHIERTPYAMKPTTRRRFDDARKALQDPERWPSSEDERTVDRIIRVCWERGWRPEEKAA